MKVQPLTHEQLLVFLSYFPTLTLRFLCNNGVRYVAMDIATPKMLNHLQRLKASIALLTLEGHKEMTALHSPRYALDVSGIAPIELEWVYAALVRRKHHLAQQQTKDASDDTRPLDHGDRSQWSYWQGKRFAMATVQLRHAVLSQDHHWQPNHHGRQHLEEFGASTTQPTQYRSQQVAELGH